jgi:two-component sensor histidine kinase
MMKLHAKIGFHKRTHCFLLIFAALIAIISCQQKESAVKKEHLALPDSVIVRLRKDLVHNPKDVQKIVDSLTRIAKKTTDYFLTTLLQVQINGPSNDFYTTHLYILDSLYQADSVGIYQQPALYAQYILEKAKKSILKADYLNAKKLLLETEEYVLQNDSIFLVDVYERNAMYHFYRNEPSDIIKYVVLKFNTLKNKTKIDSLDYFYKNGISYLQEYGFKEQAMQLDSADFYLQLAEQMTFQGDYYYYRIKTAKANVLGERKKYGKALQEHREIYQEKKAAGESIGTDALNLGINFQRTKNYDSSNHYLLESIPLFRMDNDVESVSNAYGTISFNFSTLGDYPNAYLYLRMHKNIQDSLFNLDKEGEISKVEQEFTRKIKNEEIKNIAFEKEIIKKNGTIKNWLLATLAMLSLMAAYFSIQYNQKQKLKQQIASAEMEQQLLRSQMDPHFIFNSIASMKTLVATGQNELADKYLSKFARLLRLVLENSTQTFVDVVDEIEALENYIQLQQMRYSHAFTYTLDIDEKIKPESYLVSPMLIQPFVENAIEHGLKQLQGAGLLYVSLSIDETANHSLFCTVTDNGNGLNAISSTNADKKKSLSTQITIQRLQLLSNQLKTKGEMNIQFGSETKVTLRIPYK